MTNFKNIKFGLASAADEGSRQPELLLDGFFNNSNVIDNIKFGDVFIVLGTKGAGKTAIGEHLRLVAESDSNTFVRNIFIEDMPFSDLGRIVKGSIAPESKYPTAWSWLLLLYLFSSFFDDAGASSNSDSDFNDALEVLLELGLLPAPELQQAVLASTKNTFKIKVPAKFAEFEAGYEKTNQPHEVQIPFFVERLKQIACNFKSESKHFLVIDGLDDILMQKKVQYNSLAALVFEVSRLNAAFYKSKAPARIILLCRTDLYERLPGPNKNKIRQDSAEILDWFDNPRDPRDSNLIKLINNKAKVTDPSVDDVFSEYFPEYIETTRRGDREEIRRFLLSWTRHTPRDLIMLMRSIQKYCSTDTVSDQNIWEGIRWYSIDYFLPEIKDELAGYFSVEDLDLFIRLLMSIGRRDFAYGRITSAIEGQSKYARLDVLKILNALFDCGAIHNVLVDRGNWRYTSKYRNREAILDTSQLIGVHKGLWKAMNLI